MATSYARAAGAAENGRRDAVERLLEVGPEVVDVLGAGGKPQQPRRDSRSSARACSSTSRCVSRRGGAGISVWVEPEADGGRDQAHGAEDGDGGLAPAPSSSNQARAGPAQLVVQQLAVRVEHVQHLWVAGQPPGDRERPP